MRVPRAAAAAHALTAVGGRGAVRAQGDYFGEAALVNQSKRGASVQAHGNIKTFYLERTAFAHLFQEERFNVQFAKRAAISAEAVAGAGKAAAASSTVLAPPDALRDKPGACGAAHAAGW